MADINVGNGVITKENGGNNSQWLNERDYEKVRKSINNWPEWKRQFSSAGRPQHDKTIK